MKRRYRLGSRDRFWQVRQQGKSWSQLLVVLCVLPNGLPYSRFGVSASRKVGPAVCRNHVKRLLRESVRLMWPQIAPGWDMVWIARPPIAQASYHEVTAACARLLRRAQLIAMDEQTQPAAHGSTGIRDSRP